MHQRAEELAKNQREISISEFFAKNWHLLGFDSPARALLMVVKEAVDNSLDATTEISVLPDLYVETNQLSDTRYYICVEDNGPGIIKKQIPNIFAKLLYGSKFHRLIQNRGQQGIGISASVLYSQLTTGKTAKITSKTDPKKPAHYFELSIDTKNNTPLIAKDHTVEWHKDHGTKIELEIEAKYLKGKQSVDEYIKQTAIVNPHASITYKNPEGIIVKYLRITEKLPHQAVEIKIHPHGIELGTLIKMLHDTSTNKITGFLQGEFSRIGNKTADNILLNANIKNSNPRKLSHQEAEKLFHSMQTAKIAMPRSDCLSPITSELLEKGLRKEIDADYYVATSRNSSVYRGMPFLIEVGMAYGGNLDKENTIRLLRFANRVPLLYQQGACAITEAVLDTNWRAYSLQQSGSNLPVGPLVLLVHIASVWVPFTSEAKEAIAHYPEIIKEIKLALQDCGRKLASYIRHHIKSREREEKINLFEKYIPEVAQSLHNLTGEKKDVIINNLQLVLKKNLLKLKDENEK